MSAGKETREEMTARHARELDSLAVWGTPYDMRGKPHIGDKYCAHRDTVTFTCGRDGTVVTLILSDLFAFVEGYSAEHGDPRQDVGA